MKDPRINRENANKILNWCFDVLGKSRFNGGKPKLIVHNKKSEYYGHYNWEANTINVYLSKQDTFYDLIDTVIHEFWHYKQNMKKNYERYLYKNDDKEHQRPYEKAAYRKAKYMKFKCYDDLFKL